MTPLIRSIATLIDYVHQAMNLRLIVICQGRQIDKLEARILITIILELLITIVSFKLFLTTSD